MVFKLTDVRLQVRKSARCKSKYSRILNDIHHRSHSIHVQYFPLQPFNAKYSWKYSSVLIYVCFFYVYVKVSDL